MEWLATINLLLIPLLVAWMMWHQHETNKTIMAKLNELESILAPVVTTLEDVGAQLGKAKDEIIAALGNPEIPASAQEKLDRLTALGQALKGAAQTLDDLNEDPPEPPAA